MSRSNNLRKARDAGYRARYAGAKATANPWDSMSDTSLRMELREAWLEGWRQANNELA